MQEYLALFISFNILFFSIEVQSLAVLFFNSFPGWLVTLSSDKEEITFFWLSKVLKRHWDSFGLLQYHFSFGYFFFISRRGKQWLDMRVELEKKKYLFVVRYRNCLFCFWKSNTWSSPTKLLTKSMPFINVGAGAAAAIALDKLSTKICHSYFWSGGCGQSSIDILKYFWWNNNNNKEKKTRTSKHEISN